MSKGPTCHTCSSPQVEAVDAAVADGRLSLHRIADLFGLKYDTVRRHKLNGHVVDRPRRQVTVRATQRPELETDASVEAMLREIVGTLRRVDTDLMSPHQRTQHIEALRRALETLSKMVPVDRQTVTIEEVEGFQEQVAAWFLALEPFPDAREAMLRATRPSLLPTRSAS